MEVVKTICQMCYFYCGLDVHLQNGKIRKIEGTPDHPVNKGGICPKGIASQQLVTDRKRLTHPLLRIGPRGGGRWKEITWGEALKLIGDRLGEIRDRHGPEFISFHRGQAPGWDTAMDYAERLMNALGSPNLFTHGHLCFTPRAIAHRATYGGVPEPDFDNADCIVLWGFNPAYTSLPNYARRIMAAKSNGTKLIVIDPRFTEMAAKADLWLAPRPGTDLALALGMAKVIVENGLYDREFVQNWTVGFEELVAYLETIDLDTVEEWTGVPKGKVEQAALLYTTRGPAALKEGNGLDQHVNVVQTVRAISLLPVLTGNVNVKGGNVIPLAIPFPDIRGKEFLSADWEEKSVSRYPLFFRQGRALHDGELFRSLETGEPYRIRALIVQGGDVVGASSGSDRVRELLAKLDFLVVHDLYLTATAELADLVLPATSFLERDLLLYYRYRPSADVNLLAWQQLVVPPVGESRSDLDLIFDLAHVLELKEAFPWENIQAAFEWQLSPLGLTLDQVRTEGFHLLEYKPSELYRTHGRQGFRTESGKAELYSTRLERFGYDPLPKMEPLPKSLDTSPEFPLTCGTSLKLGIHTHTQFRTLPWIRELEPDPFVEIHPAKARELWITDGAKVVITSPWGSTAARARLTRRVAPEVVMLTHGYGEPYTGTDWPLSNQVTPHEGVAADPISGATSNRLVPCRLEIADPVPRDTFAHRLTLVSFPTRCVGCRTCEVACQQEHGEKRIRLVTWGPTEIAAGETSMEMVPLATDRCDLCESRVNGGQLPACVRSCATQALKVMSEEEVVARLRRGECQLVAMRLFHQSGVRA